MTYQFLQDQNPYFRSYLGRYLKQKRTGLALSQEAVANRLEVPIPKYQGIESGRAKVSLETFEVLFSFLELDYSELIEISRIAKVAHANGIAKELSRNYPV